MKIYLLRKVLMSSAFGLLFTSCVSISFNKPISILDKLSPTNGYVYGRFITNKSIHNLSLRVRNIDTSKYYYIRFQEGTGKNIDIFSVSLPPGNYQIEDLIMTSIGASVYGLMEGNHTIIKHIDPHFMKPFSVMANSAYYIGDFYGSIREVNTRTHTVWIGKLEKYEWAFKNTSGTILKEYPNFRSLNLKPAWD